jgi:hypothetical protein
MSSNVGSFYFDRLEEFLPEKKLVAEKKLIRRGTIYPIKMEAESCATSNA